jgi:glycine oxidase
VIGAGLIGLATAFELRSRGASVIVLEAAPQVATGATRVAAGMLAPVGELDFGEPALLEMNLASAAMYPDFVSAVESASGHDVSYRRDGALHVALDRDEAAELRRILDLQVGLGLESRWLGPGASRDLEPGLSPGLNGSVLVEGDGVVDPRALSAALVAALTGAGVELRTSAAAKGLVIENGRLAGVELSDGGTLRCGCAVAAGGAESGRSSWLPEADRPPVRPVKGQVVELRGDSEDPLCRRILTSERVYVVPRPDGRVIIGATVEEMGYDTQVTAGGVHELLREAYRLVPEVAELGFVEVTAGLRPGTPDNLPVVGESASTPGLVFATGHYRNGILLTPVTARTVADAVETGRAPEGPMAAASPDRFSRSAATDARRALA